MGNRLAVQTAHLDYYLHDLSEIVKDQNLGNGRFLKTIKCQHTSSDEGAIVVKVYVKRVNNFSLKRQEQQLTEIYSNFLQIRNPNVFPYQKFIETDKAGYLIRQYFLHNLYDRIGTRPFLTTIEKKWIAYQGLKALSQAHFYGICHGDIKCENIMITSWNWLYLTDFACYKPTFIPEDDPLDFTFFFDTSERATCYLAPERFYSSSTHKEAPEGDLTPAMDIFSLGCCIAELFLEGVSDPLFSLSQLHKYRKGEYDPNPIIEKIKDEPVQSLIKHMIQKEPTKRYTAPKYLIDWSPSVFPGYFDFLHSYMAKLMLMDADKKIATIHKDFDEIRRQFSRNWDRKEMSEEMELYGGSSITEANTQVYTPENVPPIRLPEPSVSAVNVNSPQLSAEQNLLLETEKFINHLKSAEAYGSKEKPKEEKDRNKDTGIPASPRRTDGGQEKEHAKEGPIIADTINSDTLTTHPSALPVMNATNSPPQGSEGFVMILDVVCSTIRNVKTILSKLTALDIFQKMIPYLDDKCRLQRMVPYVVTLLADPHALLRATALRTLTKVLAQVTQFPPGDSHIFPEYILPALAEFHTAKEEIVREAFAENLAQLAEIARRFLEASQFFKQVAMSELSPGTMEWMGGSSTGGVIRSQAYDSELTEIQDSFHDFVFHILTQESSPLVKRCLLMDITRLCIFFGREKTVNTLLPHIITHEILNGHGPWELRAAFFHNIVGVSAFVGIDDLEKYILPCIEHALSDEEEFVIDKAVNCIASLCELGLFRKQILFKIAVETSPMLLHPNTWIRFGVVAVMAAIAKQVGTADVFSNLIPILRPFLVSDIIDVTEANILESLKAPVLREAFDNTVASMKYEEDVRPTPSTPTIESLSPSRAVGKKPTDGDDSFDVSFHMNLTKQNISYKEKEKLTLMRNYLKTLSRRKLANKMDSEGDRPKIKMEKYTHLSATTPVHTAALPASPSAAIANMEPSNVGEGPSTVATRESYARSDSNSPLTVQGEAMKDWHPKGILVAHLHEHKGAVNRIKTTRDNLFFATCSDDGTVKIWDSQRLEKNVTNRSRLTYSSQGGRITDITICENSHTVASASDQGSIHVFRIDYVKKEGSNHRYTGVSSVKYFDKTEGSVVGVDHFNTNSQSVLVYGTTRGTICGWDLREQKEVFRMQNPSRLGLLRSFIVDRDRNWLLTVTSRGYFTCWDLRFNIPIKSWRHPDKDMVYRMMHYNSAKRNSWIYSASGNNEVDVWDIETGTCKQLFRVASSEDTPPPPKIEPQASPHPLDFGTDDLKQLVESDESAPSVRAILSPMDCPYLITAGTDRRIRLWNMMDASKSYTICGLPQEQADWPPVYAAKSFEGNDVVVYQECPNPDAQQMKQSNKAAGRMKVSTQHHAAILDLAMLELPHRTMLLSCSRDGVVKVWK